MSCKRVPARAVEEVDITDFDASTFYPAYVDKQRPLCVRGGAAHWPAAKWTPEYFAERFGEHSVPVSLSCEEREATRKTELPLADFVSRLRTTELRDSGVRIGREAGAAEPYMKQFDLLAEFPHLRGALRFWEFFSWKTLGTACFWLGGRDSVTGLHNDDENNVLVQFYGRKKLILFPPDQGHALYVNDKYDSGTLCCDVDPESPDLVRHSRFAEATPTEVVLHEGDALFVPRYWFHYVRSLDTSISVNYFASTPWELARDGFKRCILHTLHLLGLYKAGNCVCHAAGAS